jgi:NAD(P)-dependent dehydrogenase (short-subunit alcohol dehydrogenase family)
MDLTDRFILITGGAHRLGKEMALHAARLGMHVAITYKASAAAAQATCAEIEALGRRSLAVRCDQANPLEIQSTVNLVVESFGRIDCLVNSASILYQRDFFDITPQEWDEVQAVNTRGPFFFTQAVASLMLTGEGGAIINLIDESVLKPSVDYPDHTISKSGLWALTRLSALRLAPKIRVNAILPGAVLKPGDWDEERWQSLTKTIPLKRLGSPQDVCRALEFLLLSDYITGQMIVVEGGTTIS